VLKHLSPFALPLVGTTNNSAPTASPTPFLDPIQQQIQQHELLKQLNIMNKQLKLLRTQPTNTNTSVPLENVTNLLGIVANLLHQRQLMPKWKTRRKVRKSQRVQTLREYVAVESLILSMPMATKFAQRKKIKKLVKNKRNWSKTKEIIKII
jgi:hypothetical protein